MVTVTETLASAADDFFSQIVPLSERLRDFFRPNKSTEEIPIGAAQCGQEGKWRLKMSKSGLWPGSSTHQEFHNVPVPPDLVTGETMNEILL